MLRFDMWLVRTDRTGKQDRRHVVLTALHGARIDFVFPMLAAVVPRLQAGQYDFRVATRVAGTLRGRLTRDGRVVVALETSRADSLEKPETGDTRPGRGGSGRKVLNAALGEAIEIELPSGDGYSRSAASPKFAAERPTTPPRPPGQQASRTEPVVLDDGMLQVNFGPFFQGERLSVIVQVRKTEGLADPSAPPVLTARSGVE